MSSQNFRKGLWETSSFFERWLENSWLADEIKLDGLPSFRDTRLSHLGLKKALYSSPYRICGHPSQMGVSAIRL
jgi:hypothetical protein